jgi:phytoene dehydrogenase-like protein
MEAKRQLVIIGGGVAGLCAGIYASRAGLDCAIYEGHSTAGGNLTGWVREGHTIDNCIHWLTGTREGNELNRIWHEVGVLDGHTSVHRRPYFDESEWQGLRLGLSGCPYETANRMSELSPCDEREIDRFIRTVLALEPVIAGGTWNEKSEILGRIPDLIYYRRMTLSELASKFHHPLLRLCMPDYLSGEFSALALLFAYAAYASGNGSIPAGGSRMAAKSMEETCRKAGCQIHVGTRVQRITVQNGRATGILLEDGRRISADYVIAACDPSVTFTRLLPHDLIPARLERRINDPRTPVFSAVQVALACDREALPAFGTRIISAKGLPSIHGDRLPLREYSDEGDPSADGKTVLQAYLFQKEAQANEWIRLYHDPMSYRAKKEEIAQAVMGAIEEAIPTLKDRMTLLDVWTPATYHRYFGARAGAFLSNAMTPSAPLRAHGTRVPRLRGCSLATQWLTSPGGLPSAAKAGKLAATDAIRALIPRRLFSPLLFPHSQQPAE